MRCASYAVFSDISTSEITPSFESGWIDSILNERISSSINHLNSPVASEGVDSSPNRKDYLVLNIGCNS